MATADMAGIIASMTPEQLAQTPAAMPPAGVTPNLIDPPSGAPVLITVSTVLFAIMLVFAALRFYVKLAIRHKMASDDWTTLVAVIGACWYYGIVMHAATKGKFGIHMWDLSIAHTLSDDFLIASFFLTWPTGVVWAFAKTSFFLMYLQMFSPFRWLRWGCYLGLFVNWGFYIAITIASIYYQAPDPGQTWQEGLMNDRYTDVFGLSIPAAAGSLILDVYIFVLPMVAVSKLQLTTSKKLGVIAVFTTGLIACVASSLSIYFKENLSFHENDYTYWVYPVVMMAEVEMCVGISCGCMPTAAGFFKGKSGTWKSWGSSAFGRMRGIIYYGKDSSATKDYEGSSSLRNTDPHTDGKNPYVDIEMQGREPRDVSYGGYNQPKPAQFA